MALAALGMSAFLAAAPSTLATLTWTGAVDNNWSIAGNWNPAQAPATGDDLVLTNQVDMPSGSDLGPLVQLASLTLSNNAGAGNFLINGDAVVLQSGGSITDNSTLPRSNTLLAGITLNGPATIAVTGSSDLTLAGTITGAGGLTLTNSTGTDGYLTVAPGTQSTYSGATRFSGNAMIRAIPRAVPTGSPVTVESGASVELMGDTTYGSLAGDGTITVGADTTLAVGGDNTSTSFSGVLQDGPGFFLALTKEGSGTLTLAGANTYIGATTVSGGTLSLTGSLTSTVTIDAGGTFGGTGTNAGNLIVVTGGTLSPGTSVGTLTAGGDVLFAAGGAFEVEVGPGATADRLDAAGTVSLGNASLNVVPLGGYSHVPGTVFTIIDAPSPINGMFAGGTTVTAGGHNFRISYDASPNEVRLTAVGTPLVAPAALPALTVDEAFTTTLTASGGLAPYTLAITAGALPDGLTLTAATGVIAGTPTTAGPYSFTITATDDMGETGTQAYSGTVTSPLAIAPGTLPTMTVGEAFTATLTPSGGTAPYTFSVSAGSLPDGLTLDGTTGVIAGTPTTAGPYSFTITATDSTTVTESQVYTGDVLPMAVPSMPVIGLWLLGLLIAVIGSLRLRAVPS